MYTNRKVSATHSKWNEGMKLSCSIFYRTDLFTRLDVQALKTISAWCERNLTKRNGSKTAGIERRYFLTSWDCLGQLLIHSLKRENWPKKGWTPPGSAYGVARKFILQIPTSWYLIGLTTGKLLVRFHFIRYLELWQSELNGVTCTMEDHSHDVRWWCNYS